MKKSIFRLILMGFIYLLPVIFSGCCIGGGSCCGNQRVADSFFRVIGMNGKIYDGTNIYDATQTASNIASFSIKIESVLEKYSKIKEQKTFSSGMLYACSPGYNSIVSKDKIKKISVTSNKIFNNSLNIGVDLSSIFLIDFNIDLNSGVIRSSPLGSYPSTIDNNTAPTMFNLRLTSFPSMDKKHIFTIKYEQENGVNYTYVTPEITFP